MNVKDCCNSVFKAFPFLSAPWREQVRLWCELGFEPWEVAILLAWAIHRRSGRKSQRSSDEQKDIESALERAMANTDMARGLASRSMKKLASPAYSLAAWEQMLTLLLARIEKPQAELTAYLFDLFVRGMLKTEADLATAIAAFGIPQNDYRI